MRTIFGSLFLMLSKKCCLLCLILPGLRVAGHWEVHFRWVWIAESPLYTVVEEFSSGQLVAVSREIKN